MAIEIKGLKPIQHRPPKHKQDKYIRLASWCTKNMVMLQKFSLLEKTNRKQYAQIIALINYEGPQDIDF